MSTTNVATAFDPVAYRGELALVLVLAPSTRSPAYEMQMDLLSGASGELRAHGVVVARLLYEGVSRVGDQRIEEGAAERVRAQYAVDADAFCVVVLDVDGAERRRDDAPLQPEAILAALTTKS